MSSTNPRRGDVTTVADKSADYTGKPRPILIVQSDAFPTEEAVTICPITSHPSDARLIRVPIEPSAHLALDHSSFVEVDKITTVRRSRLGPTLIGRLSDAEMDRVDTALTVFLGLV